MDNDAFEPVISRSREELDQPSLVARMFEPFTKSWLIEAGLAQNMHVLDVCSGAGDLAFLARDIVGPGGQVTGFDHSVQGVAFANERAEFRGYQNVHFVEADIENLPFGVDFDAIIGRWILSFRQDPVADLQMLVRYLRNGGILAFQDFDHLSARSEPQSSVFEEVHGWAVEAFRRAGVEVQMGSKLYPTFVKAGLPWPRMRVDGFIGGAESIAPMLTVNAVRMLGAQAGSPGPGELESAEIETLEERVRIDLALSDGIIQSSLLIGAWTRLPA